MRTDVNARDCTWLCTDTVEQSALTVEKKSLPHRGMKPASATYRSEVLQTELHTHPFSRLSFLARSITLDTPPPPTPHLGVVFHHTLQLPISY